MVAGSHCYGCRLALLRLQARIATVAGPTLTRRRLSRDSLPWVRVCCRGCCRQPSSGGPPTLPQRFPQSKKANHHHMSTGVSNSSPAATDAAATDATATDAAATAGPSRYRPPEGASTLSAVSQRVLRKELVSRLSRLSRLSRRAPRQWRPGGI